MDNVIIFSGDSHITMDPDDWERYLDPSFHQYLPGLREDNALYTDVLGLFANFDERILNVIDGDHAWRSGGVRGIYDRDRRLAEMDREGVAAEMIFPADQRAISMFFTGSNRYYEPTVRQAGVRAYHRWAYDHFGGVGDRFFLVAESGPGIDMSETLREANWAMEHGFWGASVPGFAAVDGSPPLWADHFDPFWSLYGEARMPVCVHAGWGERQGKFFAGIVQTVERMRAEGRDDLLDELQNRQPLFKVSHTQRRAMWQMMLGGVFDRHPDLKLVLAEIRGDWLPGTLRHLDRLWERNRDQLPAKRRPSEYFATNVAVVLSFVHRAEIELRHQIGADNVMFARDYPHAEGTWPNSYDWLAHCLGDVPEVEARAFMGENAIRMFGLDRHRLAETAARVGPSYAELMTRPAAGDEMVGHWQRRGGYLKPAEVVDVQALEDATAVDLALLAEVR